MEDKNRQVRSESFEQVKEFMKKAGETTIANVAYATGFSQPTVASVIKAGIEEHLFLKMDIANSSGGRRPQLYAINRNYAHSLLILVENKEIYYQIVDYIGEKMCGGKKAVTPATVRKEIVVLIEKMKLVYENLVKCCISLPCIVNDGIIVDWIKNKGMNGVDFRAQIENETGVKTVLENDMKIFSLACTKYVPGYKNKSVAVVSVKKESYGMGMIYKGTLIRGHSGFAGEVSFMPFSWGMFYAGDKALKIIQSVIALYNPSDVVVYIEGGGDKVGAIAAALRKKLPEEAIPEFTVVGELREDMFAGLLSLCNGDSE